MNVRFRFFTAILLSFFVHFILMALIPSNAALRQQDGQDVLQVFMRQDTGGNGGQKPLPSVGMVSSVTKKQALKNKPKPSKPLPLPAEINFAQAIAGGGQISGHSPWLGAIKNFQNQTTATMAQAKAAHQREMQAATVTAGLSSLSAQLRPLISGKVVCVQQASVEIKCTPAQQVKTQTLLQQLFGLALEARRLGIAENPLHMDFGANAGVSITLLK